MTFCELWNDIGFNDLPFNNGASCIFGEWPTILSALIISVLAGVLLGAVLGFIKKL